jgi:FkbM family methyltransferase
MSDILFGPYNREDDVVVNESSVCCCYYKADNPGGVLLEVGAAGGGDAVFAAKLGLRVFAFEPNPKMFNIMARGVSVLPEDVKQRIHIFPEAVGEKEQAEAIFFASDESDGIGTLSPFTDGHKPIATTKVITLKCFVRTHSLKNIAILKIDTEGYDFFVLKGMDWSLKPEIIMCEYDDRKTKLLGYNAVDMANFLLGIGYNVYVSEWHPIIRYGIRHQFNSLRRFTGTIDSNSWGNLIAFAQEPDVERFVSLYKQSADGLLQNTFVRKSITDAIKHIAGRNVVVWGIGKRASDVVEILTEQSIKIARFIDKRFNEKPHFGDIPVVEPSTFDARKDFCFIGTSDYMPEVACELISLGATENDFCRCFD